MQIEIIKPGLLSTIQDTGRIGYRHIGMPTAGCMDHLAADIANYLVGNESHSAVLELTYGGFEFIARSDLLIACGGQGASMLSEGKELPFWRPVFVPSGKKLKFITSDKGVRQYLAIAGGWCCEEVLLSRSTYLPTKTGGYNGRAFQKADLLVSNRNINVTSSTILMALSNNLSITFPSWGVNPLQFANYHSKRIRFIAGHEYEWFDQDNQQIFENSSFAVSHQSSRMGCYFDGSLVKKITTKRELYSTGVSCGTIQVTNSGKIVLLMADSQTTGGYPRIAQVAAVDIPICAQLRPGDSISFEKIGLDQADDLLWAQKRNLKALKETIKFRFI